MRELVFRLSRAPRLQIGARSWAVLFTHDVLLTIEETTGKDVLNGQLQIAKLSARELRIVLWALLTMAGARYQLQEVGKLLAGPGAIQAARESIWSVWRESMPPPDRLRSTAPADKPSEPHTWLDSFALAHQHLHVNADEWLSMTPRMLHALLGQYLESLRQQELMQSRIIAAVINWGGMGGPKEKVPEDKFMLHPWPQSKNDPDEHPGMRFMRALSGLANRRQ